MGHNYKKWVKKVFLLSDLSPGGIENDITALEIFLNTAEGVKLAEHVRLSDKSSLLIFEHIVSMEEE